MPGLGQWVSPTLNPQELQKRIDELRVVQFWLEQNTRMISATVQALEVQRMTLHTLNSMNVPTADLQDALKMRNPFDNQSSKEEKAAASVIPPPAVDPLPWWNALTEQFSQLTAATLKQNMAQTNSAKKQTSPETNATSGRAPRAKKSPTTATVAPKVQKAQKDQKTKPE
jgi:hypothetical protein